MSRKEAPITFHLLHHNSVRSTALPSATSLFQLTQGSITQPWLLPGGIPFLAEVWLLCWARWRRRWWGWVLGHLQEERGRWESLHCRGTRVLGWVSVLSLLSAKTACVFHCYQSGISCQLQAFPFWRKKQPRFDHSLLGLCWNCQHLFHLNGGGKTSVLDWERKGRYQVVMWEMKARKTASWEMLKTKTNAVNRSRDRFQRKGRKTVTKAPRVKTVYTWKPSPDSQGFFVLVFSYHFTEIMILAGSLYTQGSVMSMKVGGAALICIH